MKCISHILIVFSIWMTGNAQIQFNRNYDDGNFVNSAAPCYVENDTTYIVAGQIFSPSFGFIHLLKLNKYGDTILTRKFGQPNYSLYAGLSESLIKAGANYYLTGADYSPTTDFDILLAKFDSNLDTIFFRTYIFPNINNGNKCFLSSSSAIMIVGNSENNGAGTSDFMLMKCDTNGNLLWQKFYGGAATFEEAVSGQQTLDGGFILSGRMNNNTFWVVKTDSAGNQQWTRNYPGTQGVSFIKQLPDSGYVISGSKFVVGYDDQAHLIRTDKLGFVVWQGDYGGTLSEVLYANPVILPNGEIVVSGRSLNSSGWPYGLLLKVDALGNQQWLRTYFKNPNLDNYFYDVKPTLDGGYIMSGNSIMSNSDAWVVKVDSVGCEIQNCNLDVSEDYVFKEISVFPNPANNLITIALPELGEIELRVMDISGRIIHYSIGFHSENEFTLDVSEWESGLYLINFRLGDQIYSSRFVKN